MCDFLACIGKPSKSDNYYLHVSLQVLDDSQLEVRTTAQASHEHQLSKISLVDPTAYLLDMQNSSTLHHISNPKQISLFYKAKIYHPAPKEDKELDYIFTLLQTPKQSEVSSACGFA